MCNNQLYARRLGTQEQEGVLYNILERVVNILHQQPFLVTVEIPSSPTVESMPEDSLKHIMSQEGGDGRYLSREAAAAGLRLAAEGGFLKADLKDFNMNDTAGLDLLCGKWISVMKHKDVPRRYCSATWDRWVGAHKALQNTTGVIQEATPEGNGNHPAEGTHEESDWGHNYPSDGPSQEQDAVNSDETGSKRKKSLGGSGTSSKGKKGKNSPGLPDSGKHLLQFMMIWAAYVALLLNRPDMGTYVGAASGAGILMLFGLHNTFTRFHLDQFGALCWGVAVGRPIIQPVIIAYWLCVQPSKAAVDHVHEVLSNKTRNDLSSQLKQKLRSMFFSEAPSIDDHGNCILGGCEWDPYKESTITGDDVKKFHACCNPEYVKLVEHLSGQYVRIFPGWMHYVVNVRDNVKASVEVLDNNTDLVVGSWYQHTLGCRYFGVKNAEDYTNYMAQCERMVKSKITSLVNSILSQSAM
jgi:hypothetical protein